jgi:transmembrane sensor
MKTSRSTPLVPAAAGDSGTGGVDATAAQWVVRRRAGLDAAGEREFTAWCAETPAHADAFARMSEMSAVFHRARVHGASGGLIAQLETRRRQRRVRRRLAVGMGTALALLLGLWTFSGAGPRAEKSPMVAQAFEPLRRLSDGSIVELNRGAEITVAFDSTSRRVELVRGEALFRVEKDPGRPFIVSAGGVEVRAVGTAFNVRLNQAKVEVLVTEGKVGVDDTARGASLLPQDPTGATPLLVAGQRMVVAPEKAGAPASVQLEHIAPEEIKKQLSWRIPLLEFDGVELAQAVTQMNRENRLQIVIPDETIRKLRISGTFVSDDPQTFARMVAATFGLDVKHPSTTELVLQGK